MKNDDWQVASGERLRGLLVGFVMVGQVAVARRKFLMVTKVKLSRWLFVLAHALFPYLLSAAVMVGLFMYLLRSRKPT